MNAKDIYTEMKTAYKNKTPGKSTIFKWLKKFKEGREALDNDPRPGRPINYDENAAILQILEEQPFDSSRYISDTLYFNLKININTLFYLFLNNLKSQILIMKKDKFLIL